MNDVRTISIRPAPGFVTLALAVMCLLSCSAQPADLSPGAGLIKLDVCISSITVSQIPVVYAQDRGIFAKHGLDVTLIPVDSGSRAVAALISGSVQLCQISGPAVVNAGIAGADVAIVGGLTDTNLYSIMVSSDIRSPADLKGKAVAVSTAGSSSEISMRMALRILGLRPHEDVTILSIGGQAERMAAMDAGYVAGTIANSPETLFATARGYHALVDLSAMNLPYQDTGTVVDRSFVRDNRAVVLNYMKAVAEAVFMIKRNRQDTLEVLGNYLQLDLQKDAAILEKTYDLQLTNRLNDIPYPTLSGIQAIIDEIAADNPDARRLRPEDIGDMSIVMELEGSGFFKELEKRR